MTQGQTQKGFYTGREDFLGSAVTKMYTQDKVVRSNYSQSPEHGSPPKLYLILTALGTLTLTEFSFMQVVELHIYVTV